MSRIRLPQDHEIDPDVVQMIADSSAMVGPASSLSLRALAHRPDIVKSFMEFYGKLQTQGLLSRKLVELIRLAAAQIHQCPN
jgi:alkylhydroperoxidase family enzyme